jgi:hypothetical protein
MDYSASVSPPGTQMGEEQHSLEGEGVGVPYSDDHKERLALCFLQRQRRGVVVFTCVLLTHF